MPKDMLGGRYKVLDKIGVGGMASVYRGMDTVLNRSVAIKIMLEQYAQDPSFAARFKQEAQAAAALSSPYIVGIYDWGKDGDTYYIVMELLRGTDLKTGLKNHGALEPRKVAQIGSQICQALSVAHRHDIIHRDIKPQNIMVQPDGNIKVMDFGIARARNSHLTATNSVLGTAHYVSPEQTQGKDLGPTSDIYSLGVVMYEAATGRVPFDGDDAITVALKQVNEEPVPPSQINPKVDANLEAIILKCMAKDPAQRYQTADELRRALMDYLSGRVVQATVENGAATALVPASATRRMNGNGEGATRQINRPAGVVPVGTGTNLAGASGPYGEPQPKKRHTGLIVGIIVAIIAVVALVVWFFMSQNGATQMVPNYVSLTRAEAEQRIAESDFWTLGTVGTEYSDTVERGVVISQDPESGISAARGTAINLVVSRGQEPAEEVAVPDLKNMTPDEAQKALEAVGLVAKAGEPVNADDVDEGRIATQDPAAGATAKVGDDVTYHLSNGPQLKDVPDVNGYSRSDAVSALEQAGFAVSEQDVYSSDVQKGYVVDYQPTGKQPTGTTIVVSVSQGPNLVDIPSTIGDDVDSATAELQNLGFTVNYDYRDNRQEPAGQVVGFSPSGSAPYGATITLVVSNGPGTGGGTGYNTGGGTGGATTQSRS